MLPIIQLLFAGIPYFKTKPYMCTYIEYVHMYMLFILYTLYIYIPYIYTLYIYTLYIYTLYIYIPYIYIPYIYIHIYIYPIYIYIYIPYLYPNDCALKCLQTYSAWAWPVIIEYTRCPPHCESAGHRAMGMGAHPPVDRSQKIPWFIGLKYHPFGGAGFRNPPQYICIFTSSTAQGGGGSFRIGNL